MVRIVTSLLFSCKLVQNRYVLAIVGSFFYLIFFSCCLALRPDRSSFSQRSIEAYPCTRRIRPSRPVCLRRLKRANALPTAPRRRLFLLQWVGKLLPLHGFGFQGRVFFHLSCTWRFVSNLGIRSSCCLTSYVLLPYYLVHSQWLCLLHTCWQGILPKGSWLLPLPLVWAWFFVWICGFSFQASTW